MSKKSSDKHSKSKSANSEKGSVAFVNNGLLKSGFVRFFWSAEADPTSTAKEYVEHYGPSMKCRYVTCSDPETVFSKLLKTCGDKVVTGNLVEYGSKNAMDTLKEVSGAKQTHLCEFQDKKSKDKKEKSAKATAKKSKKDEDEDENEDDDEKEDSDKEDSDNEDDEKKEGSDDEVSDAAESEEEEEEEKPKKSAKKDSKGSKDSKDQKGSKNTKKKTK